MKIRAQSKMVNGRPRWYVVQSCRDGNGRPRTKWLVYLGGPPNHRIKRIIADANKHPTKQISLATHTQELKKYVRDMRATRHRKRSQSEYQLSRRRTLYAAHKAGLPSLKKNDHLSKLCHMLWNMGQAHKQMQAAEVSGKTETFQKLTEGQKERLRVNADLILKELSRLKDLLTGSKQPGTRPKDARPSLEEDEENPDERTRNLMEKLKILNEREAKIISGRYGLTDGKIQTLAALASKLGVTRERVRQIEKIAMAKLRINTS